MEETQKFIKAMVFIDAMEGGYTGPGGLQDDPGKETNWGVTQRTLDKFRWRESGLTRGWPARVAELTKSQARVYYQYLWKTYNCEQMAWPLCLVFFDACVNQSEPVKLLQRSLDIDIDNKAGPQTEAAIKMASNSISSAYMASYRLMLIRVFKYDSLDQDNPKLTKFLTTVWINRIRHLFSYIEEVTPPNGVSLPRA